MLLRRHHPEEREEVGDALARRYATLIVDEARRVKDLVVEEDIVNVGHVWRYFVTITIYAGCFSDGDWMSTTDSNILWSMTFTTCCRSPFHTVEITGQGGFHWNQVPNDTKSRCHVGFRDQLHLGESIEPLIARMRQAVDVAFREIGAIVFMSMVEEHGRCHS